MSGSSMSVRGAVARIGSSGNSGNPTGPDRLAIMLAEVASGKHPLIMPAEQRDKRAADLKKQLDEFLEANPGPRLAP